MCVCVCVCVWRASRINITQHSLFLHVLPVAPSHLTLMRLLVTPRVSLVCFRFLTPRDLTRVSGCSCHCVRSSSKSRWSRSRTSKSGCARRRTRAAACSATTTSSPDRCATLSIIAQHTTRSKLSLNMQQAHYCRIAYSTVFIIAQRAGRCPLSLNGQSSLSSGELKPRCHATPNTRDLETHNSDENLRSWSV